MKTLLTSTQIATHLNVKKSTIYNWTHTGYIPHIKVGRLVRFDKACVEKWLKNRTVRGRTSYRIDTNKHLLK